MRVLIEILDISKKCVPIKQAIKEYPLLQKYACEGKLDFGNSDALRLYNIAIAKIMFNLDINLPIPNLIPTICLRYYYVKVVFKKTNFKKLLEIGTGSTAIMAMIAAKQFGAKVDATEINTESINNANIVIERNNLSSYINIIPSQGEILEGILGDTSYDALICYPPMYPEYNRKEYTNRRKLRGFQGNASEMIGGGEDGFDFISQLLFELIKHRNKIQVFTLLNIQKSHAHKTNQFLQNHQIENEVIQIKAGNRIRFVHIAYLDKK